ncbi:MAG: DUF4296 domain-containing protein [Deltaproteobacteria bacterium]|nr:DUF4296 domain-containing protein [Deltaproteobacteria bacterium]
MLFCSILWVVSCADEVIERPDNLIPQEKMINIIYDMAVLNAAKEINTQILSEYIKQPSDFIFNKYGIDSVQYTKSDLFYASIPAEYDKIYNAVKMRLDKEKSEIDEKRRRLADSARQRTVIKR